MNRILLLLLFIGQVVLGQTKLTQEEINLLNESVKANAKNTKTIVSDFVQKKHLDFLTNDIKTEGNLIFKAPNLIKWEYKKPYSYIAIFKENAIYINDNGDKNSFDLSSNKSFKHFNKLIVSSIKGDLFSESDFIINYFKDKENYLVKFEPKNESFKKMIKSFELLFDKKTFDVVEIKMNESNTDYTKISFLNKKLNQPVSNDAFSN
ncbi:LolA family protein [Tenacibaculum caenipelagi]|uniref:Outer membrane lipoprotein-sorting protein n=1 Tax=Tenacibaculum caenipelagi TaxID=1325435 RepID=A0A4R6TJD0_9FLAO|nr:outer membrane lipoprotein carrier protein LolA [Tenacibaculum caenipelagi]TDQ28862.1 outer membrane lipoprotein-sorting protein [Tenacibaculum caenipelagi]